MPVTKEFLTGVNNAITEDQITAILKEYDSDLTGIKINRDEIKKERDGFKANSDKLTVELTAKETGHKKQIEELEKQIKASGSDELKAYYEAENKKLAEMSNARLTEAGEKYAAMETRQNETYVKLVNTLREVEFEKAAEKVNNIDPAKKAMLRDLFFTRNQFDFVTTDGVERFLSKDGSYKTVNDIFQSFIATEEGKFFLLANSTGGGASGSSSTKSSVNNPYKKETFNLTEQMILEKENPEKAASLKAQAGVK
jgi:hypothetical protein